MTERLFSDRINQAGADTDSIARTSILIKIGDIKPSSVLLHPVYALSRALAAMFGTVHLCGAASYFEALEQISDMNFVQHPGIWLTKEIALQTAPDADIIIDMTNDVICESFCQQLSLARARPCISLVWGRSWVAVSHSVITSAQVPQSCKYLSPVEPPLPPLARIASGLALQEAMILAGKIELVALLKNNIAFFNTFAEDCTDASVEECWTSDPIENVVIEVVGSGAVGVHFLESFVPLLGPNSGLRIFDHDIVNIENIPLQKPYSYDDIGKPKAVAIADKLRIFSRDNLVIQPFVMSYQDRPTSLSRPSLRILCPDNFTIRKFVNDLSLEDGVPIAECGSSPLAAQVRTYVLGVTACLEHRIKKLTEKAVREKEADSCSENPALTLPGTNMIAGGGLLAIEALKILEPERFGLPSKGTVNFDARVSKRFGITDILPPCEHGKLAEADNM